MRSPENQENTIFRLFEDYVSRVIDSESDHETNKHEIRKASVEFATKKLNVDEAPAAYYATYFFKLLQKDQEKYENIWDLLFRLSQNAEIPEAALPIFNELTELNEEELTYLWIAVHGILRGDYMVSTVLADNFDNKAYSIGLTPPETSTKHNTNLKRRESLQAV